LDTALLIKERNPLADFEKKLIQIEVKNKQTKRTVTDATYFSNYSIKYETTLNFIDNIAAQRLDLKKT